MSIQTAGQLLTIIRAADHLADLPPHEIKTLLLLARHVDPTTGMVNKTQGEIAAESGWGLKTVNTNIRALKQRGLIDIIHTGRANVYRLITATIVAAIFGCGAPATADCPPINVRECMLCNRRRNRSAVNRSRTPTARGRASAQRDRLDPFRSSHTKTTASQPAASSLTTGGGGGEQARRSLADLNDAQRLTVDTLRAAGLERLSTCITIATVCPREWIDDCLRRWRKRRNVGPGLIASMCMDREARRMFYDDKQRTAANRQRAAEIEAQRAAEIEQRGDVNRDDFRRLIRERFPHLKTKGDTDARSDRTTTHAAAGMALGLDAGRSPLVGLGARGHQPGTRQDVDAPPAARWTPGDSDRAGQTPREGDRLAEIEVPTLADDDRARMCSAACVAV